MKLEDRITIQASPQEVWTILGNPVRWAEFHGKIEAVLCEQAREGASVEALLSFKQSKILCQGIILDFLEQEHIRIHFDGRIQNIEKGESTQTFIVAYELFPSSSRNETVVVETIEHLTKIPWLLKLLMKFLMKTGKTVGEKHLHKLKRLVEEG